MKSLWFKAHLASDILAGVKLDTIRRRSSRLPGVGELVRLTVGPRPAFAIARILSVSPVEIETLTDERRTQVLGCYRASDGPFVRLTFELLETTGEAAEITANHDAGSEAPPLFPFPKAVVP